MTAVHADDDARWVELDTGAGSMRGYLARPELSTALGSAVLVLQEAFGVNEHIQDVTRRLAARGHVALAPDLFHRTGRSTVDYSDRSTAMQLIDAIGPEPIAIDVRAAVQYLTDVEGVPAAHCATVGFCFGGRAAFTAATALPGLGATVVFYGPGIAAGPHAVLDRVSAITGPVLLLVGADDPTIPPEHIAAIRSACAAADVDLRVRVFPGAGHAFHCDARPDMYRPDAAQTAWAEALELLTSISTAAS
jgi:carboxymethylenebutenolidase